MPGPMGASRCGGAEKKDKKTQSKTKPSIRGRRKPLRRKTWGETLSSLSEGEETKRAIVEGENSRVFLDKEHFYTEGPVQKNVRFEK